MSEKLPQLLGVRGIMDETGLKRAGAEALMRALPKIEIPGHRGSYVRRSDLLTLPTKESLTADTPIEALLYVIDADQGVKIGITRSADVTERRRDLERSAGQRFRVLRTWPFTSWRAAFDVEHCAHELLAEDRTIGEWFHTHPLDACATVDQLVRDGNAHALRIRLRWAAA